MISSFCKLVLPQLDYGSIKTLDDRKNFNFKKGNVNRKLKARKQVSDQKIWKQVKVGAQ